MTATLGSSEAAAVLGLVPPGKARSKGPHDVWMRLVGLMPRYDDFDDDAQAAGRIVEPGLRMEYARRTDTFVRPGPPLAEAPPTLDGWLHSHPDGYVWTRDAYEANGTASWLLECKSTRLFELPEWGPDGSDQVPDDFLVQCYVHMLVHEVDRCDLIALAMISREVRVYRIDRVDPLADHLLQELRTWWDAHVDTVTPPTADGSAACARAIGLLFPPRPERVYREATEEELGTLHRIRSLGQSITQLANDRDTLRNQVKRAMAEGGIYGLRGADGRVVARYTANRQLRLERGSLE